MSRKSFWNFLGLPSFADIQELQESARRQEEALASLASVNAAAARALAAIQDELSASVEQVNDTNRSMLEAMKKGVCETIQAGIDSSRDLVSGQMSDLTREALEAVRYELRTSAEQINCAGQEVSAASEKRICDIVQACAEKSEQLFVSHVQSVTECSLAAAKAELTASLEKASGEGQEAVGAAQQKICATIHTCTESSQRILSEQADRAAESIAALSTLCDTTYDLDRDTQKRIEQIIAECRTQNELLRLLLANTLIDDVSQAIPQRAEL